VDVLFVWATGSAADTAMQWKTEIFAGNLWHQRPSDWRRMLVGFEFTWEGLSNTVEAAGISGTIRDRPDLLRCTYARCD
jgi:hypothetical protein